LRDYKFITTKKINYLKLLKLKKWQTLKESTSNGGGMVSGLIIICIGVGVLIWKFIMGNPSNFEGGNNEGIPLNTLGQVYHGAVVPVLLGMLLMVLVFLLNFSLYLRQLVKLNWTLYDKDTSKYQTGEIDEAIVSCDSNKVLCKCN
jgi:biopolymer transport protein ExbB